MEGFRDARHGGQGRTLVKGGHARHAHLAGTRSQLPFNLLGRTRPKEGPFFFLPAAFPL
jgi:hypothetical protein